MLPPHYLEYREVFDKADFDTLPEGRPWDHAMELTADFKPVDCKVYPLTESEQVALEEFPPRESLNRTNLHLQITHGLAILLRQEERWEAQTDPRLSQGERHYNQK